MDEYPKRPRFFAHRFVRLMAKVCAAQEIGIEAFTLLTIIAHTEDARGYRSPVTFFNEQLVPICGFANVQSMRRARTRAINGGWLSYQEGGKGFAGKYFVTIPSAYEGFDDAPTDEGLPSVSQVKITPTSGQEAADKRLRSDTESGQEADRKRLTSDTHSSLPLSLPLPQEGGRVLSQIEIEYAFSRFWDSYPRKENKKNARHEWDRLILTESIVSEIMSGLSKWHESRQWKIARMFQHASTWISGERWKDEPEPAQVDQSAKDPAEMLSNLERIG